MAASLAVSRSEFTAALKTIGKHASKKDSGDAVLSLDSGMFTIELAGMVVRASASGSWPGAARVQGNLISNLYRSIPPGDPVEVSVAEDRLKIGSFSIPCVWQRSDAARIHLPMEASLPEILRVALNYTPDDIRSSGLGDVVGEAEERRDSLLDRAMKFLGPLEVIQREDLRRLLDDRIRKMGLSDPGEEQASVRRGVRKQSRKCPSCGSDQVLRIQYGLPSGELVEESRRGEIILGGCNISAESPTWHCGSCEHDFEIVGGIGGS